MHFAALYAEFLAHTERVRNFNVSFPIFTGIN